MSMNLHCKEVELWQTPTYITSMCIGCYDSPVKDWKAIRDRYICWVGSHTNGVWKDTEMYNDMRRSVRDHIADINTHTRLTFSII